MEAKLKKNVLKRIWLFLSDYAVGLRGFWNSWEGNSFAKTFPASISLLAPAHVVTRYISVPLAGSHPPPIPFACKLNNDVAELWTSDGVLSFQDVTLFAGMAYESRRNIGGWRHLHLPFFFLWTLFYQNTENWKKCSLDTFCFNYTKKCSQIFWL